MLPLQLYVLILQVTKKRHLMDGFVIRCVRRWAGRMLKVSGARVTTKGLYNIPDTPAVYVANHQSLFDIPVFLATVKIAGFLSKVEIKRIPVFSFWVKRLGCVFVDRKDKTQAMRAVSRATDSVKAGYSFVVFPEGTRSRGEEIAPFKPGASTIASGADVPLVPVVIDGSYKLFEGNKNKIARAEVFIEVLPPVSIRGLSPEKRREALNLIREDIINAKDAAQNDRARQRPVRRGEQA